MTIRIAVRGLAAAGLAGLLAVSFLLLLGASPAHAQLDDLLDPDLLEPAPEDPIAPEDPLEPAPEEPEGTDLIGDLLGEGLLDPEDVLELGELLELNPEDLLALELDEVLELLNLEDLLGLLDLLGEDVEPDPEPVVPVVPVAPVAPVAQVTEVPRGGVATGAGGASETTGHSTAPVMLASLLLLGTAGGQFAARRWLTAL